MDNYESAKQSKEIPVLDHETAVSDHLTLMQNEVAELRQHKVEAPKGKSESAKGESGKGESGKGDALPGAKIGPSDPNEKISITIMVKSKASEAEIDKTVAEIVQGKRAPLSDSEYEARFGADPQSMRRMDRFAKDHGFEVQRANSASGEMVLTGTIEDFSKTFKVGLDEYKYGDEITRRANGKIFVPRAIAADVVNVVGLDEGVPVQSHVVGFDVLVPGQSQEESIQEPDEDFSERLHLDKDNPPPELITSYLSNEIADAYNFPIASTGKGQSVAIIELGGGLVPEFNSQYYKDHNLKEPNIQIVTIDGAKAEFGLNEKADKEVALDTQVIGAIAPDANQQIIFAPNSNSGFVDAINRAIFPQEGEMQNSVISISWGLPESQWSPETLRAMNDAFQKAALKGITVFAAAGDDGAKDGASDGRFTPDYPSSDPFVTGAGGTRLLRDGDETVWNDGRKATGGGISAVWAVPDYQKGIKLPASANGDGDVGRGAPDIAGNAAKETGYKMRYSSLNEDSIVGGTSAVAPLYAALTLKINEELGRSVGFINPMLYNKDNAQFLKDITVGDNDGYSAGPGWDATTGLGVLKGQEFLDFLKKDQSTVA